MWPVCGEALGRFRVDELVGQDPRRRDSAAEGVVDEGREDDDSRDPRPRGNAHRRADRRILSGAYGHAGILEMRGRLPTKPPTTSRILGLERETAARAQPVLLARPRGDGAAPDRALRRACRELRGHGRRRDDARCRARQADTERRRSRPRPLDGLLAHAALGARGQLRELRRARGRCAARPLEGRTPCSARPTRPSSAPPPTSSRAGSASRSSPSCRTSIRRPPRRRGS